MLVGEIINREVVTRRIRHPHEEAAVVIVAPETDMTRNMPVALYVVVMITVVVSVDVLFFRHHIWERLIVNIGIVAVFAAFYLRFFRKP